MKRAGTSRRNGIALAGSAIFHILILVLILQQASPIYDLPQPAAPPEPPVDAQIVELTPPPRPVIIPRQTTPETPPQVTPKPPTVSPPQPQPQPPKPQPAPPAPSVAPQAPVAAPKSAPSPIPVAPKPVIQPPETPKPAPVVAPKPAPVTAPTPPAPTPPAPPAPAVARAPPAPSPPIHLNIHKPEKEAPGNVATLPLAPAPGGSAPAGGQRSASTPSAATGEPELGGSRLQGLTPYPYGTMPSGGSGLRGSLIGCANSEAVSLSAVERARCNSRFGVDAGAAPAIDSMSPAKRATFDKANAEAEANRRYRAGMPPGTTPSKPGFGAGLGPDQPQSIRDMLSHPQ